MRKALGALIFYPLDWVAFFLGWVAFKLVNNPIAFWAIDQLPGASEEEKEAMRRDREYRDLDYAADVILNRIIPEDPYRGALAHRAIRELMKEHYPEEERRYASDRCS